MTRFWMAGGTEVLGTGVLGTGGGVLGRMVRGFESYKMRRGSILYTKVADSGLLGFEQGSLSPVGTSGYNMIQNL